MIYIYGYGGRGKLIKELLLRLNEKIKNITFIDDYKKILKNNPSYLKIMTIKKINFT